MTWLQCVLVVAVAVAAAAEENYCVGSEELVTPFLAAQENLLCRATAPITEALGKACSTEGAFADPTTTDFLVMCSGDNVLIGFSQYKCADGDLATELKSDAVMKPYSACVAADAAVCSDVQTASATSKLLVATETPVSKVALETEAAETTVYYKLACGAGYDFKSDVSGSVYGFCSGAEGGNAFTIKDAAADGCYSMCPENGPVETEVTNLEGVTAPAAKSGAKVQASAVCTSGHDLKAGAPETYEFTCNGPKEGDANGGKWTCENCPECVSACPTDPTKDQIDGAPEYLKSIVAAESAAGEKFLAGVVCDDNYSLSKDAPEKYEFTCKAADADKTNGVVSVGDKAPECRSTCEENDFPNKETSFIDEIAAIIIAAGINGQEESAKVTCNKGFAVSTAFTPKFKCEGGVQADKGEYHCMGPCPKCEATCAVPADDETFSFGATSEGGKDQNGAFRAGREHIELTCKAEGMKLVGERLLSCNEGEIKYDNEEKAICADAVVCEAPVVVGATLENNDNFRVDDAKSYKVSCDAGHVFDEKTAKELAGGSFTEATVLCDAAASASMPSFTCYPGCTKPKYEGKIMPDTNSEGAAPYKLGQKVTFPCPEGKKCAGLAEAVCDVAGIAEPVFTEDKGAAAAAASSVVALLAALCAALL